MRAGYMGHLTGLLRALDASPAVSEAAAASPRGARWAAFREARLRPALLRHDTPLVTCLLNLLFNYVRLVNTLKCNKTLCGFQGGSYPSENSYEVSVLNIYFKIIIPRDYLLRKRIKA